MIGSVGAMVPTALRILVVEDEAIIAKDIEQSLARLGYAAAGTVATGPEAIERAQESRPDLILMDVRLRGEMDGIEAAQRIHDHQDVPVVFLTAYADEATLRRAKAAEPYGYLLKPFEDKELHAAVIMAIAKHMAVRQVAALADLGLFAVRTRDVQVVMDRAVRVVVDLLGTDMAAVAELLPDGTRLTLRAGLGWQGDVLGQAELPSHRGSPSGFTLVTGEPVIIEDLEADPRFEVPPLLRDQGAISGMIAIVHAYHRGGRPYGVLSTHTRSRRSFSIHELGFLRAVANVVATALERATVEAQLREAERRTDEERVRVAQAEEAVRLRDEFLIVASHELRTPITVLQLQLQSLSQWMDSREAAMVEKLDRAGRATERLARLVETLLEVAQISLGRLTLDLKPLDLAELVREVAQELRDEALRARCEVVLAPSSAVVGWWDRSRLEQVVTQVLGNAFKYGSGMPVDVSIAADEGTAELRVTDQGPGIGSNDVTRIFQRFERAASIRHYGGLGLGLYVCQAIVEAHGGMITVASRPGRGATFVVRLPRERPGQRTGTRSRG